MLVTPSLYEASMHIVCKGGNSSVQQEDVRPQLITRISKAFRKHDSEVMLVGTSINKGYSAASSGGRDQERHATGACEDPPHESKVRRPSRDSEGEGCECHHHLGGGRNTCIQHGRSALTTAPRVPAHTHEAWPSCVRDLTRLIPRSHRIAPHIRA